MVRGPQNALCPFFVIRKNSNIQQETKKFGIVLKVIILIFFEIFHFSRAMEK